jgi:hypothetical protein
MPRCFLSLDPSPHQRQQVHWRGFAPLPCSPNPCGWGAGTLCTRAEGRLVRQGCAGLPEAQLPSKAPYIYGFNRNQ